MKTLLIAIAAIASVAALLAVFAAIGALIVAWAWSVVMVPVFGLPPLTLWQAFALSLLAGFLIKPSVNSGKK